MKPINQKTILKMMQLAGDELNGDWVIIGGSVLNLVGASERTTVDIDLAGPLDSTQSDVLKLMDIAIKIGLEVEAINQAGAFFLHKIPNWRSQLIEIHKGSKATFFRPNLELFIKLKVNRLTEIDRDDCLAMIKFEKSQKNSYNSNSLKKHLETLMENESNSSKCLRLKTVIESL